MSIPTIRRVPEPGDAEREAILTGLRGHNRKRAPEPGWLPLTLVLRHGDDRVLGGMEGRSGWGWLHVEFLWVAEEVRSRGFGSALLARAESEARTRGCHGVHFDTHDFQAPEFYVRRGYREFGVLDDYPTGHRRHFMFKRLAGSSA